MIDKNIFFSILIPTFNGCKTILSVLESIKKQSYGHYEIIIYDDCSVDSTVEIISTWINNSSLKVVFKKGNINKGSYFALKECIGLATGDYIIFTAQDNCFTQDRLFSLNNEIKQNRNLQLISSDVYIGSYSEYLRKKATMLKGLAGCMIPNINSLLMLRSSIFRFDSITISRQKLKYFPINHLYMPSEDFAFVMNIFSDLKIITDEYLHIKKPLVYIIKSDKSQSHAKSIEISDASIMIIKKYNLSWFSRSMIIGNFKLIGLARLNSPHKVLIYFFTNPLDAILGFLLLVSRMFILLALSSKMK